MTANDSWESGINSLDCRFVLKGIPAACFAAPTAGLHAPASAHSAQVADSDADGRFDVRAIEGAQIPMLDGGRPAELTAPTPHGRGPPSGGPCRRGN
jgi:hypothetical protein